MNSPVLSTNSFVQEPRSADLSGRDLLSISDLRVCDIHAIFQLAQLLKARPGDFRGALRGKQLVMFFEKPSLRTRLTFEAGMASLGGFSFFVDQTQSRLDARERLSDIAHNLERWVDIIVLRTFQHETIAGMAEHAAIPVINALSDLEHPCQALADYFTLREKFEDLRAVRLAFIGDGNNVSHSLLLTAAAVGSNISIATPAGYEPDPNVVARARDIARQTGATISLLTDPLEAIADADAVYTDVWASMGYEAQAKQRAITFAPYQVNQKLMRKAARHALFMHCLPAHRGEEVTDSVMDSPQCIAFDQAENRLHVQKAILLLLLGSSVNRFPSRSAHA